MAPTTARKAPQPLPLIPRTKAEILGKTRCLIDQWKLAVNQLKSSVRPEIATFENTIAPLAVIENSINLNTPVLTLYEVTSSHLDVGEGSNEALTLLDGFKLERGKDRALYELVHAVWKLEEDLEPEDRRLVEMAYKEFRLNGLDIVNEVGRERFKIIQERICSVAAEFQKNRTADPGSIWFTPEQLEGTPEAILSTLEVGHGQNEGKVRIKLDDNDQCNLFSYLRDEESRKRLANATNNKCAQNVPLLKEAAMLRAEAASLLGYRNHAALRLESRMAKTPEVVITFLDELKSRLAVSGKAEIEKLQELKRKDCEARAEPCDDRFYPWDYAFYSRQLTIKEYSVDMKSVEEYFEVYTTVQRMLNTFEDLFGLRLHDFESKDIVWDESVKTYSAWDEDDLGGGFLGYLYIDLLGREGKDDANFSRTLEPGHIREDGTRHYPSTILFCSFSRPTHDRPCLLSQFDCVMLFHELGHAIHDLVSRTKYSRFHGTLTSVDFGEAPSQMLENWCWDPEFLKNLSQHYSYTSPEHLALWRQSSKYDQPPEQIPHDMVAGVVASKYCSKPSFLLGQVLFAMFDIRIHLLEDEGAIRKLDLTKYYNEMIREIQMFDVSPDRADWSSPFVLSSHLMEEYDAGYYSYLFSQVYSTDMFYSSFKGDLMNKDEGRRYRKIVLEKGGSQDEMKTLREFLGRDPSIEAFYKDLALN